MLNLLETQDAIIAAKTAQAHTANKNRKDPFVNRIKAGDYVLCLSEWGGTKDDKPAKKLRQRWIGPYLVTTHDPSYTIYRLDLGDQRRSDSFHISNSSYTLVNLQLHNDDLAFHLRLKPTISKLSKFSVTTLLTPAKYNFSVNGKTTSLRM
jgi:hypothetical protein